LAPAGILAEGCDGEGHGRVDTRDVPSESQAQNSEDTHALV
jgi:hypothetical protein